MPVNPFALTEGVPTGRVGERLVQARREAGMGRWRASRVAQISRSNLVRMERGRMRPPDGTLIALCRTYDVAVSWLVPERSGNEVVVGAGRIEVAGRTRVLSGGDGDGERAVEAVLASYLAIVRELRGVAAGGLVSLRDEDLVALARSLGDTPSEIEARLVDLMKLSREEARAVRRELLKRRVAVPAAGLLLATAAVTGALDGASGGGADHAAGGTFAGARAEHAIDQAVADGGGASVTLPGEGATAGAEIAAPPAHAGGSTAMPNVSVDGGDDVVIGDAVSFVRDTPPPAAPRVVIPLPSVAETPADGGAVDAPNAPGAPSSDVAVVVADPGTSGAPGGDAGSADPGTGGGTSGGAQNDNAHGGNDNANPNAADAGGNRNDAGGNGAAADENAHGANDHASSNATDAAANGNQSDGAADTADDNGNATANGGATGGAASGGSETGAGDVAVGGGNAGGNGNGANGNGNAHGGNPNASANAANAGGNGGAGNESAGAASPSANGNGASNAHARP
jgi:transcriptional regulator with XRE-family HTH domain